MKEKVVLISLVSLFLGCGCLKQKSAKKNNSLEENKNHINIPFVEAEKQIVKGNFAQVEPTIVYKTKRDYYNRVPIILSEDKKSVISYPAPTDIYYRGKLAYPTKLKNGYLLDNRGISKNVAFTKYTYEQYSKLKKAPTENQLLESIIDKDPLIDFVNLGSRADFQEDEVGKINQIIDADFKNVQR